MKPDEAREKLGMPEMGGPADELIVITGTGATKLEDALAMAATQQQNASDTNDRANEQHQQQMSVNASGEDRAQEAHEKDMKTPIPKPSAAKPVKKADDVKKKLTDQFGSRTLIKTVKPGRRNVWNRYNTSFQFGAAPGQDSSEWSQVGGHFLACMPVVQCRSKCSCGNSNRTILSRPRFICL